MKRIPALAWIGVLCISLLVYSFLGKLPEQTLTDLPAETVPSSTELAEDENPSTQTTQTPELPAPKPTEVSYYNREPELQPAWEALAREFSGQTGVKVNIISSVPASAEEKAIPTLCCIAEGGSIDGKRFLSLSDSVAYANLASHELTLTVDGNLCGIASHVEPFGLIYNTALLARAGYTGGDIRSFSDLKAVVELIAANQETLGFDAFAKPTEKVSGLLASIGSDGSSFWGLYSAHPGTSEMTSRSAVFTLGTAGDLAELMSVSNLQLDMIPLYTDTPEEGNKGFDVFVTGYWCVRSDAREQDIQGALAFLNFLVSPRTDGTVPVDDLRILAPYRQAVYAETSAEVLFRSGIAAGKVCIPRSEPEEALLNALNAYCTDPSEETRNAVTALLPPAQEDTPQVGA